MTADTARPVDVRLLHVPDCPLAERVMATLRDCLPRARVPVRVEQVSGDFPSPTLLVGGVDVVTGMAVAAEPYCRLDLPTAAAILAALERAAASAG